MSSRKIAFGSDFRNGVLMEYHVLQSSKSKNHITGGWFMCLCIIINTTQYAAK